MATTPENTVSSQDVKKTDVTPGDTKGTVTQVTTNPERAPNIPATGAMPTSGAGNQAVVPGTRAEATVPSISHGTAQEPISRQKTTTTELSNDMEERAKQHAAQRAAWQEEALMEPVKAVAPAEKAPEGVKK